MSNQSEIQSIAYQYESILKNRRRRFDHLRRKNRLEDAIAVADEFFEWFAPEHEDDEDLVTYFNSDYLQSLYEKEKGK